MRATTASTAPAGQADDGQAEARRPGAGRARAWRTGPPGVRRASEVEIRQACGTDKEAVRDFLAGLSLRSRYQRFFTGAAPTAAMLSLLTGGRGNTDVVIASGAAGTAGRRTIIGHGMAVDTTGPADGRSTEIGVVVADARQGQGVGSALVRALVDRAHARGACSVEMEVLAENRLALAMITNHWPTARYERRAAYVTVHATLPQHEEERPGAGPVSAGPVSAGPGKAKPRRRHTAARLPMGRPGGLGGRRAGA